MDAPWWPSVVRKVFGSDSDMIHDVSNLLQIIWLLFMHIVAMRRVLHLKMVTQCAMLEEFGIFLVLADKVRSDYLHMGGVLC